MIVKHHSSFVATATFKSFSCSIAHWDNNQQAEIILLMSIRKEKIVAERIELAEQEQKLQEDATPNIWDYKEIKIIEQLVDKHSIVVAEAILVERDKKPMSRYCLRIVELKDEATVRALLHEIGILKKIGLHPSIMGLFLPFRHRQYIGLVQPAFTTLRDRIEMIYGFKKSNGAKRILFRSPWANRPLAEGLSEHRAQACLRQCGLFNREAVVYVLKEVISGLEYLGQKGFVHTQIAAANVFVNEKSAVKLGAFLHCKHLGSKTWLFTGNPNRLPPEAFLEQRTVENGKQQMRIKPNFDTWALGLFTLEMITGRRMYYTRDEMAGMAKQFITKTQMPPTLEETDSSTMVNGKQIYDPDITDFIAQCLETEHVVRKNPGDLLNHAFMSRPIRQDEAKLDISVEPLKEFQWNVKRKLRNDVLTVHTSYAQVNEDLLKQICNAVRLIRDQQCCPIFDGHVEKGIQEGRYIAVDVSLAFQKDEEQDWSRDVLDISMGGGNGGAGSLSLNASVSKTPGRSGEQIQRASRLPGEEKDYQHSEMVFFVKRDWSTDNRRLFIALQFARWFDRELISFADLVRVVDELEDILMDYMVCQEPRPLSPYKHQTCTSPPQSVAFVTGLRRSLTDPESTYDPETHRYNNIYVEVALGHEIVQKKKKKMDLLRMDDPVTYPKDAGALFASATFYALNLKRLQMLESVLLGEQRVAEWDFDAEQKKEDVEHPQTPMLTTLLQARRMNPNAKVSSEIDWETSNQARRLKLWGDYTRDFMFRFAKYAVPYQLDHATARLLHGSPGASSKLVVERLSCGNAGSDVAWNAPGQDELLQLQLARTSSKQEDDALPLFKRHDDVEMRENYVKVVQQNREKDDRIQNLEEQLKKALQRQSERRQNQSPMPPRTEEIDADITRLPKYRN